MDTCALRERAVPQYASVDGREYAGTADPAETGKGEHGFGAEARSGSDGVALRVSEEGDGKEALPAALPGGFYDNLSRAEEALLAAIQQSDTVAMEVAVQSVKACLSGAGGTEAGSAKAVFFSIYKDVQQLLFDFDEENIDKQAIADSAVKRLGAARGSVNEYAAIILDLSRQIAALYGERAARKKTDIVLQAKRFIERNFQSSLTVNEIAAALFISAPYLYRLMREELGISPAHYLNNLRIRYSTAMLRNTERSITVISTEAGFETEQSFYRQFRKQMGCTPSQYRSQYRR